MVTPEPCVLVLPENNYRTDTTKPNPWVPKAYARAADVACFTARGPLTLALGPALVHLAFPLSFVFAHIATA